MNNEIEKINITFPWQILDHVDTKDHLLELFNYITNLQEENERLKEENKRIFSKVNDDELLISNAMNYAEAQDYKSRNEKAIKHIKEYCIDDEFYINLTNKEKNIIDVLNILQGGE